MRGTPIALPLFVVAGLLHGAALAAENREALEAAELVRTYYRFQGIDPSSEQLTAGVPAALELLQGGWSPAQVEAVVVQLFRARSTARTEPFEAEVRTWMAEDGADLAAKLGLSGSGIAQAPSIEAPPSPIEPIDRDVAEAVAPEPIDEKPNEPVAPEPIEETPVEPVAVAQVAQESPSQSDIRPTEADRVTSAEVRIQRSAGITRQARTGLILLGSGLLVGGMVGSAAGAAQCAYASDFMPGHTPIFGALPLAGPAVAYEYWKVYGEPLSVKMYGPVFIAMTVMEVAGVALIVFGAAAPGERRGKRASRERVFDDLALVPSIGPGAARVTLSARF